MNQNSDINYYKINPSVLNILKQSIDQLFKFLDNFISNLNNKKNCH